jgi:sec-independent protein translocase protein TatA
LQDFFDKKHRHVHTPPAGLDKGSSSSSGDAQGSCLTVPSAVRTLCSEFRAQTGRVTHQERLHVPNIGLPELAIVLIIALVVFGPKRLPEMGRQLGRTLREFKSATSDIRSQIGIDDIADSVNDLKSGLSLTSDSPRPATETAAGAAVGAAASAGVAASAVVDSPASALADAPAPAMVDTVSTDVPADAGTDVDVAVDGDALTATDEPVDGSDYTVGDEPVDGSALTIADEPVDGSTATVADEAVDDDPAAVVADGEGDVGVEAFGSLTRGSASSSARTAAD